MIYFFSLLTPYAKLKKKRTLFHADQSTRAPPEFSFFWGTAGHFKLIYTTMNNEIFPSIGYAPTVHAGRVRVAHFSSVVGGQPLALPRHFASQVARSSRLLP